MKVQNTLTTGTSRRVFTAGAISVVAALALSACGGAAATAPATATATAKPDLKAAGAGTITMWVDAERSPALKDITAKFQADTGIEVKLVVKDFAAVRDDFITQVPTGKGPDLIVGPHDWVGKFVQNGVIAPVELGDKKAAFQESSVKAMTFNGSVYGVPYAIENIALLRNTDIVPGGRQDLRRGHRQRQEGRRRRQGHSSRSWSAWTRSRATRTTCTRCRPPWARRSSARLPTAATIPSSS